MTDLQAWVGPTYLGLADLLESRGPEAWDSDSLCEGWLVRNVVAHVTMPARLTVEQFGAEMTAAGGDFTAMSDGIAIRDGDRPTSELLEQLRSPALHAWQPPGGGEVGALSHAVIHSLDVTIPLGQAAVAPPDAVQAILEELASAGGDWFGVDLTDVRLEATDVHWNWGNGNVIQADSGALVALVSGRALPDGRSLNRVS